MNVSLLWEERTDVTLSLTLEAGLHLRESESPAGEVRSKGISLEEIAPEPISNSARGLDANLFVCSLAVSLCAPHKDQLSLSPSPKKITAD